MNLDNALWICYLLLEAILVGLLLYRRAWNITPVFLSLCVWETISNIGGYFALRHSAAAYEIYYLIDAVVDSTLEFAVIVELTWSVLRPIRHSLPRFTPIVVALIVLAIGAAIWPFSGLLAFAGVSPAIRALAHFQQTTSILRILFFVALAASSQLLSIGWRDRELQIATGLGFFSLVSLGMTMIHTHQSTWVQYRHLNQFLVGSYICSLAYWIFCFAQKEAERREFTPQMQNLLLAVAGVARSERAALSQAPKTNSAETRKR